jgi:SEC-C motif-containing protein
MDNTDYIIATTHPNNPTYRPDKELWKKEIHAFSQGTQFKKLDILDFTPGEQVAYVTFKAHLTQNGQDVSFTERSRFERVDGRWLYHSGEISQKAEGRRQK